MAPLPSMPNPRLRFASHGHAPAAWSRARSSLQSLVGPAQRRRIAPAPAHPSEEDRSVVSATASRPTRPLALRGRRAPGRARRADPAPRFVALARERRGPEAQVPRRRTSGSTAAREPATRATERAPMACVHRCATASGWWLAEVASAPDQRGIPAHSSNAGEEQDLHQRSSPAGQSSARESALPLRSRS